MWFIVLIVLAVAAFFIIKAFKSRADQQAAISSDSSNTGRIAEGAHAATTEQAPSTSPALESSAPDSNATVTADADAVADTGVDANSATSSNPVGPSGTDTAAVVPMSALESGDTLQDVREMIKVLNLRSGDASRLSITREQFDAIWAHDAAALSDDELSQVATRLRKMLA